MGIPVAFRVLIVEDDPVTLSALCLCLEGAGYEVVEAGTAGSAMNQLAVGPTPDMVFLDLFLPGGSGLLILGEMRRTVAWKNTPVVALSAADENDPTVKTALRPEHSPVAFFKKPVEPAKIIEVVKAIEQAKDAMPKAEVLGAVTG